jgi:hypothetical protein
MPTLTAEEFAARSDTITPALQEVVDFLHHDSRERACNRSFGETTVSLHWEDGFLRSVMCRAPTSCGPENRAFCPAPSRKTIDKGCFHAIEF